jgi:protoporphyrinogen oxidase
LPKKAIIIGAGPAGLTAGLELLRRTDIQPVILEASQSIGGISRTIRYKGNRMDIGGHRFFSKSDRVMHWWMEMMPLRPCENEQERTTISYQGKCREIPVETNPQSPTQDLDRVMLIRPRRSRIYFLRRFFDYPITLSKNTLKNLGVFRTLRVGWSYFFSRWTQIKPEKSLEDFLINRFGRELYQTFFKSYTEKVWGTPCNRISAEWGAQRIKGLSLSTAIIHFLRKSLSWRSKANRDVAQKGTNTSLIELFLYPKFGPGQLWEHVADEIVRLGGEIHMGYTVVCVNSNAQQVDSVEAVDQAGNRAQFPGNYFFSTMPVRELIQAMRTEVPDNVRYVSSGLQYRDFITVGLLADRLKVCDPEGGLLKDTWIYVQEPDVLLGRLQIFNNWSPYLVSDPEKIWIGLEYFCYETDDLWKMPDEDLTRFAISELVKIGILDEAAVSDSHVARVPKAYPAYFGTYDRFCEIREWTDSFENLFLIGRNGMHKYNNQDHSMLTALTVVDGLCAGEVNKAAVWGINTEQDYHEQTESRGAQKIRGRVRAGLSPQPAEAASTR